MELDHLLPRKEAPFPLHDVLLGKADDRELRELSSHLGLGLSLDEMRYVRDHFAKLGRDPTDLEVQAIGQAWSEHACYKTSRNHLKKHLIGVDTPDVLDRGDAGVMRFHPGRVYTLRIESHNHPSAIGPYGGAATGIGGIVRDVLAMGSQPIALIDPLFFGDLDLDHDQVPRGTKHPRYLLAKVVDGIRDYGNRLGIPTVCGAIYFDQGYTGNCLVNVGCVGAARDETIMKNRVSGPGDLYLLVGGRTGRDGIHGVTFASMDLSENSEEEDVGAVQLGDPITEEPVIHATLEAISKGLVLGLKDLGGGGLSCVIGEMALAAGCGALVHLDPVPLKEADMAPWEMWISESQERMMLAVAPEDLDAVLAIFDLYDVEANVVGEATDDRRLRIDYMGVPVADTDLSFIYDAPLYDRPYVMPDPVQRVPDREPERDIAVPELLGVLPKMLSDPNLSSRDWVIRQYDHEVRGGTVLKPLQGSTRHPTHGDGVVMKPFEDLDKGLVLSLGVAPFAARVCPYRAGKLVMDEMIRNMVAVGARPHSFTNCLNLGNPEKEDRMGEFVATVRGMGEIAEAMNIPTPSGNVSFYNEAAGSRVPPTAVVLGAGILGELSRAVSTEFKAAGNRVYLIGRTDDAMGGSSYYRITGHSSPRVPDVDPGVLKASTEAMLAAHEAGLMVAAHDISDGGLAVALAEMCFGSDLGATVHLCGLAPDGPRGVTAALFSESPTRWVLEVSGDNGPALEALMKEHGIPCACIGEVTERRALEFRAGGQTAVLDVENLHEAWSGPLWDRM